MCMAKVYREKGSERELVCEDLSLVEIDGKKLRFSTLFGDVKEIEGQILEIDFQGGSIVVGDCP